MEDLLVSGSHDKTVRLGDPFTETCQSTLHGHSLWVSTLAFFPDRRLLASASYDKTIKIWDMINFTQLQSLNTSEIRSHLNFSNDGSYLESDLCHFAIAMCLGRSQSHSRLRNLMSICAHWILWGGERLVLLHLGMRPQCHVIRDNVIAIGYRSGRVTIVTLDVDSLPPQVTLHFWFKALN